MRVENVRYLLEKGLHLAFLPASLLIAVSNADCRGIIAETKIGGWSARCDAVGDQDAVCNAELGPLSYQAWKNEPDQRTFYIAHQPHLTRAPNENIDREYDLISVDGKRYPFARRPLSSVDGQPCFSNRTVRTQDSDYDSPKGCISTGSGLYVEIAAGIWVQPKFLLGNLMKARRVRLRYKEFDEPDHKDDVVGPDASPSQWRHHSKTYNVRRLPQIASWCENILGNYTSSGNDSGP